MSLGVSIRIVRNFRILKCVLWIPTLFCLKNTGPLESSLMAMIKTRKTGDRMTSPRSAIIKSIPLFTLPYIPFLLTKFPHSTLQPLSSGSAPCLPAAAFRFRTLPSCRCLSVPYPAFLPLFHSASGLLFSPRIRPCRYQAWQMNFCNLCPFTPHTGK